MSETINKLTPEDFGQNFDPTLFSDWKKSVEAHEKAGLVNIVLYLIGFVALVSLKDIVGLVLFFGFAFVGLGISIPKRNKRKRFERELRISNSDLKAAIAKSRDRPKQATVSTDKVKETPEPATTAKKCQRCNKTVLTRNEFASELNEMGMRIDASGNITADGAFKGYGALQDAQARVAKMEGDKAIQCKSCGNVYCVDCLAKHAPRHRTSGGKACFSCGGSLQEI